MKKEQINPEDFNFFRDENGNITAEPKKRSLKLDDIIKDQIGCDVFFAEDTGVITDDVCDPDVSYIDQISQKSARKVLLFGYIQRIADYANDGWKPDCNDETELKFIIMRDHQKNIIIMPSHNHANNGIPLFRTTELALQAYTDNKSIFDEFFYL